MMTINFKVIRPCPTEVVIDTARDLDPASDTYLDEIRLRHPLAHRNYILPTPSLRHAVAETLRIVEARISGAAFTANPRFGKSSAIAYILQTITTELPGRTYLRLDARDRRTSDSSNIVTDLLVACGSVHAHRGRPAEKFERLILALFARTATNNSDHLVLIVDEAQRYREGEWDGLLAISNAMHTRYGVRLCTLLWGQPSLAHRLTALQAASRQDLTGRFMAWMSQFRGIASVGELRETLEVLDSKSEFPEGSGRSYVAAYLPHAVAGGLRMSEHAGQIWDAFASVAELRGKSKLEIGMEWISLALEDLIVNAAEHDEPRWRPTKEAIELAVQVSGFASAVETIYVPLHAPNLAQKSAASQERL